MNLYLISQEENSDYDVYDSAVVAAPDEETARDMHPSGYIMDWAAAVKDRHGTWVASRDYVKVDLVGVAVEGTAQGIICASFNAG